ncbi:TetR/AcrR family transcriptional regulator [Devosia sp. CAU 1758]
MARTYLNAEKRREQILDCAQALFFGKGYEATTVQDLMLAAGVSKGGFYHHFAAKEDVLEALSVRLAQITLPMMEEVMQRPGLSAFERLNGALRAMGRFKKDRADGIIAAFATLLRPENLMLYDRINRANIETILPLFQAIIEEGRLDGSFNVPDASLAAQSILRLGGMTHDAVARAIEAQSLDDRAGANAELERALIWQGIVIDRILGLPDGSVTFVEPGFVDALLPLKR